MTITANGIAVTSVVFNGVDCDKVYMNGALVFEKITEHPFTIVVGQETNGNTVHYGFNSNDLPPLAYPYGSLSPLTFPGTRASVEGVRWSVSTAASTSSYSFSAQFGRSLGSAIKVTTPNGAVLVIPLALSSSTFIYQRMLTLAEFNSLPKSGTHTIKIEAIP